MVRLAPVSVDSPSTFSRDRLNPFVGGGEGGSSQENVTTAATTIATIIQTPNPNFRISIIA